MNEALAREVIERSREAAIKEGVAVCITVVDEPPSYEWKMQSQALSMFLLRSTNSCSVQK